MKTNRFTPSNEPPFLSLFPSLSLSVLLLFTKADVSIKSEYTGEIFTGYLFSLDFFSGSISGIKKLKKIRLLGRSFAISFFSFLFFSSSLFALPPFLFFSLCRNFSERRFKIGRGKKYNMLKFQ